MAPEEIHSTLVYLNKHGREEDILSMNEFRTKYIRAEIAPAATKNNNHVDEDIGGEGTESWMCLKRTNGACIFLTPSGSCSIYDVRPVQCSTYPFWPSLLKSKETWNEESVLPDDIVIPPREGGSKQVEEEERHWSSEKGGCEGIGKVMDTVALMDLEELGNLNKEDLDIMVEEQMEKDKQQEAPMDIVGREEITQKMKEAKKHWKRFPVEEIKRSTWYL